jgi:glutamine synthetase type III
MDELKLILDIASKSPGAATTILGASASIVAIVGYLFKIDIDKKTSSSAIQEQQTSNLIAQITLLSDELNQARRQLKEIHDQNVALMHQLRISNMRIGELEIMMSKEKPLIAALG